jgi:uncharacterized protein YndB with AHSA1/START domain
MTDSADRTIPLTRRYRAPLSAVWNAYTDPAEAALWWGPRGYTVTSHGKDLRAGGFWDYTMHGPNGTDFPNFTRFIEVLPQARLVYDHGGSKTSPPMFRVETDFRPVGGETEMKMKMILPSAEAAVKTRDYVKKAGGEACWDRLAEYLAKKYEDREIFVINRAFDTSLKSMFELWTRPKIMAQWLPPTGFRMTYLRDDLREGGSTFSRMEDDAGHKMYGRAEYKEIREPDRIVYTQQFCDENERITRHPLAPTWPETMRTEISLAAEGPDRTRVTIEWTPVAPVTAEELATFINARTGMTAGWTGSLDKLEEFIFSRRN